MTGERQMAEFGSVSPFALAALRATQAFFLYRERVISQLIGRRYRRSPLREDLMRMAVIWLAEGRIGRVSEYQAAMTNYGSRSLIRTEIDLLVGAGLLVLNHDPRNERATQVWPTRRLVRFYNESMPLAVAELRRLLSVADHGQEAT